MKVLGLLLLFLGMNSLGNAQTISSDDSILKIDPKNSTADPILTEKAVSGFPSVDKEIKIHCACSMQEPVEGPFFKVHGRLSNWNGNPTQRIWIIGTHRMLGIREGSQLPDNLLKLLGDFDTEVYGDFVLCPLTRHRARQMQIVCVEHASNLRVEKRKMLNHDGRN
jgi:hypothetical protein